MTISTIRFIVPSISLIRKYSGQTFTIKIDKLILISVQSNW